MDMGSITLAIAITGAVTGILGLVFNFLNTWRAFDRDKIKLKVIPKLAYFFSSYGSDEALSIEVINVGFVPVTLSRVVFPRDGTDEELHFRQHPQQEVKLPVRLEPRDSITIFAPIDLHSSPEFANVSVARAWTACGRTFQGASPALQKVVQKLRDKLRKS
jgi:hypothetical protein